MKRMLFMFAALVFLFYATIACAEEFTALNLVPREKYWFAVPPPQVDVRAYGISVALSSDKCTWSDPIDFTFYQIDKQTKEKYEVSEVFKTRIYPRDIDKLRFYNVLFVKDLDEVYSDSGQQKIFLDVAKGKQAMTLIANQQPIIVFPVDVWEKAKSKKELAIWLDNYSQESEVSPILKRNY